MALVPAATRHAKRGIRLCLDTYVIFFSFFFFGVGLGDWENSNRNEEIVAKIDWDIVVKRKSEAKRNHSYFTL